MIEHYKDNKKNELRFVKNRFKSTRTRQGHGTGLKRQFKHSWHKNEKVITRFSSYKCAIAVNFFPFPKKCAIDAKFLEI